MKIKHLMISLIALMLLNVSVMAQNTQPKREFRGAWIQCVNGQFQGMGKEKMQQTLTYQLDELQKDENVASFECNVLLKGIADDLYTSDFVIKMFDGTTRVRECVWRINLQRPSYTKLLDDSRNYWLSHGVDDWGIVIEKEDPDEDK